MDILNREGKIAWNIVAKLIMFVSSFADYYIAFIQMPIRQINQERRYSSDRKFRSNKDAMKNIICFYETFID